MADEYKPITFEDGITREPATMHGIALTITSLYDDKYLFKQYGEYYTLHYKSKYRGHMSRCNISYKDGIPEISDEIRNIMKCIANKYYFAHKISINSFAVATYKTFDDCKIELVSAHFYCAPLVQEVGIKFVNNNTCSCEKMQKQIDELKEQVAKINSNLDTILQTLLEDRLPN